MPDEKANARNRRKRERDRAAGLVRFEDLLPDHPDVIADMRERAAMHRDERARQNEGET